MPKTAQPKGEPQVRCDDLLAAETTLHKLHDQMAAECKAGMDKWPRDWMQKHVNERACLIKARQILIDRAEAEQRKPCVDQGDGYWDCSPQNACVKPQCSNCPQKAAND